MMKGIAAKLWSAVAGDASSNQSPQGARLVLDAAAKTSLTTDCVATLVGHEDRVWSVAWHPTLPLLATCGGDKTTRVWQCQPSSGLTSWSQVALLEGEHQRTIRHVEWSPNGLYLSCASFDATVSLWALKASERTDGTLSIDMSMVAILEGHENEVKNCRWAPHQIGVLATCSRDKTVWVWERENGSEVTDEEAVDGTASDNMEFECGGVLSGHSQDVKSVNWLPRELSPSGKLSLLSCSYDSTIKLWEESPRRKDDWFCAQTLPHGSLGTVWEVAIRPLRTEQVEQESNPKSRATLVSATEGGTLRLWRPNSNGIFQPSGDVSVSPGNPIFSVDWDPSGLFLAAGCGDNSITLFCLNYEDTHELSSQLPQEDSSAVYQWEQLGRIRQAHSSDVNCVRFAPAAFTQSAPAESTHQHIYGWIASCGDDDVVRIWKLHSGTTSTSSSTS
mmetsp:Transcript_21406/g.24871  ORF Transcript_21406/g.24871 Transcript_21406/m.24871 type:complete len:447 (-) Transcript_21406:37-1377(-)